MNDFDSGIVGVILLMLVAAMAVFVFIGVVSYDSGQMNGYCQAKGGTVESDMCIKDDVVIKRGVDL